MSRRAVSHYTYTGASGTIILYVAQSGLIYYSTCSAIRLDENWKLSNCVGTATPASVADQAMALHKGYRLALYWMSLYHSRAEWVYANLT